MKKINLEQMQSELQNKIGYKNGPKLELLVNEYCELNSKGALNVAGLAKILSSIIYENHRIDQAALKSRVQGLQLNFNRKKEIIAEAKKLLEEMEEESVNQEESLGSYSIQIDAREQD